MRNVLTILGVVLLSAGVVPCRAIAADASLDADAPPVVYTRQTAFGLPYFMDPAEPGARRAVEVQLHVSEKNGPWRLVSKSAPSGGSIMYRASRDGEYRFMMRTKDDHGEIHPAGQEQAELVVVVDTEPPVLELFVERGSRGEVRARWRVRDAHLRYDSLRLEYQVGVDGPWNTVAVDLPAVGATSSAREATWLPEARQVPIIVRAEVGDMAGNIAKTQRKIEGLTLKPLDATTGGKSSVEAPSDGGTAWPAERTYDTPFRPGDAPEMSRSFPKRSGAPESQPPPEHVPAVENVAETLPPPQSEHVLAQELVEHRPAAPYSPEEVSLPPSEHEPHRNHRTRRELESSDGPRLPLVADTPPTDEIAPLAGALAGANADVAANTPATSVAEPIAPIPQPTQLATRQFNVGYNANLTPDDIKQVEVWGTRDTGRSWKLLSVDSDRRSPAAISVDSDGIYGFRIVVMNNAGLRGATPKAGDAPDIFVNVDTGKPTARLTGTSAVVDGNGKPGESGAAAGTANAIVLRWEAGSAAAEGQPISLYYSPQAAGPWFTIAEQLGNSGEYVWRPDSQVPSRVYLRMVVRDAAGNVQAVDAAQPVTVIPSTTPASKPEVRPISTTPTTITAPSGTTPPSSAAPTWQEYRR